MTTTVTPTVAVSINSTTLNLAYNTATVTFTFSEAPTDFSLNDVTSAEAPPFHASGHGLRGGVCSRTDQTTLSSAWARAQNSTECIAA